MLLERRLAFTGETGLSEPALKAKMGRGTISITLSTRGDAAGLVTLDEPIRAFVVTGQTGLAIWRQDRPAAAGPALVGFAPALTLENLGDRSSARPMARVMHIMPGDGEWHFIGYLGDRPGQSGIHGLVWAGAYPQAGSRPLSEYPDRAAKGPFAFNLLNSPNERCSNRIRSICT